MVFNWKKAERLQQEEERQAADAKRRQRLLDRLSEMESGEKDIIEFYEHGLQSSERTLLTSDELSRWDFLSKKHVDAMVLLQARQDLKKLRTDQLAKQGTPEEIDALANLLVRYRYANQYHQALLAKELGFSASEVNDLLNAAIRTYYEQLLPQRYEATAFSKLRLLVERLHRGHFATGRGHFPEVDIPPYPDDWNALVALHYEAPLLSDFQGIPDRMPGEVRLLAALALQTRDFEQAQIVLAYCQPGSKELQVVGSLAGELAKLVAEHRAAYGAANQTKE